MTEHRLTAFSNNLHVYLYHGIGVVLLNLSFLFDILQQPCNNKETVISKLINPWS